MGYLVPRPCACCVRRLACRWPGRACTGEGWPGTVLTPPMRIGFDVTPLCVPQSGIGTYTLNLLDHLGRHTGDEIVPLAHRPWQSGPDRPDGYSQHLRVNRTVWMQAVLPWHLGRLGLDVCHFTNNVSSIWTPCPAVVTIHDMSLWLFPEYHRRRGLVATRPFIPLAARRAAAIITV
jgi:hypothetical protein